MTNITFYDISLTQPGIEHGDFNPITYQSGMLTLYSFRESSWVIYWHNTDMKRDAETTAATVGNVPIGSFNRVTCIPGLCYRAVVVSYGYIVTQTTNKMQW